MTNERISTPADEQRKLSSDAYLRGIIDYVKWTTTLSLAALLWIGNMINSTKGDSRTFALIAVLFLILSFAPAILSVRQVLDAWDAKWVHYEADYRLLLLTEMLLARDLSAHPLEPQERNAKRELAKQSKDAFKQFQPFSKPGTFKKWVSAQTMLLIVGLIFYIISLVL